ncbi:hypothetical protein J6TS7_32130 [Paenibacillus dendritiformis]|nr:hypothetical protein J6TS7_32130 [Paenibacillus dendritiformis]
MGLESKRGACRRSTSALRTTRNEQMMIRLRPEIKEKFQKLCEAKGMTMSTMVAYMIGDYVQRNWTEEEKK